MLTVIYQGSVNETTMRDIRGNGYIHKDEQQTLVRLWSDGNSFIFGGHVQLCNHFGQKSGNFF